MKDYQYCLRCGRKLKNAEYRKIGMGKTCQEKMRNADTPLFRMETYANSQNGTNTKFDISKH